MAGIAYVQGVSVAATTAVTATTGTITSTSANALIVAAIGGETGTPGSFSSVTDSKGNTYSLAVSNAGSTMSTDIWYCTNITGGASHTVTGNYPVSATVTLLVQEFSGLALTGAFDQSASNGTVSPNATSGNTPTTTVPSELIIGCMNIVSTTSTVGAGFSNFLQLNTNSDYPSLESKVVSSTGQYAANFINTSATWLACVATFKAANTVNNANFMEVF